MLFRSLKVSEGAAYGGALQALWCWRNQQGEKISITNITDEFVQLNHRETAEPIEDNVAIYDELQLLQTEVSESLRGAFHRHRAIVAG